jgi:hypoxanthine phosphoribosyltransferase
VNSTIPALPERYKLAFSREQINTRLDELGKEITEWALKAQDRTGKPVLGVCILRGGAPFFCDLVRRVPVSIEMNYCRTWSYSSGTNVQQKGIRISVEEVVAEQRAILLVDDICDTGATLLKLNNVLLQLGAVEVRTAVLVHRMMSTSKYAPNWEAFSYRGEEWFVGYGMEDKNQFSNLPEVYTITP